MMRLAFIEARDLPDAWSQCVREVLLNGYEYVIDSGSFAGEKRKEFDFITVHIQYPGTRPLVPDTPLGVPPPTTMEYVEKDYYPNYIMGLSNKKDKETYTYGDDIASQIPQLLSIYNDTKSFETNLACMTIGNNDSINLEHSQCLRIIDTRIRYGKLHFIVYFRSWDLWGGFPTNLAAIQLLKESVAKTLGVNDGELIALSKGLHLYEHCFEVAKLAVNMPDKYQGEDTSGDQPERAVQFGNPAPIINDLLDDNNDEGEYNNNFDEDD